MKRSLKIAIGILIGMGLLALALLFLNSYVEGNIKTALENNLDRVNASYKEVDVKLLDRKAEVIQPTFSIRGKTLEVDTISLDNIKLWKYLTSKDIIAGDLNISNPVIRVYNLPKKKEKDSAAPKKNPQFEKNILLEKVIINGGSFQIFEKDSSRHRLYTSINQIRMQEVRINSGSLKEAVPFNYDLLFFKADSIFYNLDPRHEMTAADFSIANDKVLVRDLRIIPKYSKAGHQKTISVEADRYDLVIDSVSLNNLRWSVQNDTVNVRNSFAEITGVNFNIYRDRTQPDDTTYKPLYSEMIRSLPIKLSIDSLHLNRTFIRYEEFIKEGRDAGIVEFSALSGKIRNITNIGMGDEDFPKTVVTAQARFMRTAPLYVNWEFYINDRSDAFQISGDMGGLPATEMNKFLKPAMNILAEGEVKQMDFNYSGNNNQASGNMKLEYKDFKLEVLRKDGQRKNKVVSAIANLFVKDKTLNEEAEYKDISFTRDKTKSFWNYFWNLIRKGALKTFI
ncbi:hypothetical protein [Gramella sp. KN1008]|uniref:hypothetical protein n=1 Tax=Gramella sp. KN1008 TaxID=2529298 RepID=UPI001038BB9B|nr:hypothetical protein [Gramella sp. KN1008]TBW30138.1 hypothetical protein EZJ28_01685 [Gramella sp. KN1008]